MLLEFKGEAILKFMIFAQYMQNRIFDYFHYLFIIVFLLFTNL